MAKNGGAKYRLEVETVWFGEDGQATALWARGADIIHARSGGPFGAVELHLIAPAVEVRMDPRALFRVRAGEYMPPSVGSGDYLTSFVQADTGELWHIFAGQYDRGVMTGETPDARRAITKQKVLAND